MGSFFPFFERKKTAKSFGSLPFNDKLVIGGAYGKKLSEGPIYYRYFLWGNVKKILIFLPVPSSM